MYPCIAKLLGHYGLRRAPNCVAIFNSLLNSQNNEVQIELASSILKHEYPEIIPVCRKALTIWNAEGRSNVARLLGELGEKASLDLLVHMAKTEKDKAVLVVVQKSIDEHLLAKSAQARDAKARPKE